MTQLSQAVTDFRDETYTQKTATWQLVTTIIAFFVFAPFGLICMWGFRIGSRSVRIMVTVITILLILIIGAVFILMGILAAYSDVSNTTQQQATRTNIPGTTLTVTVPNGWQSEVVTDETGAFLTITNPDDTAESAIIYPISYQEFELETDAEYFDLAVREHEEWLKEITVDKVYEEKKGEHYYGQIIDYSSEEGEFRYIFYLHNTGGGILHVCELYGDKIVFESDAMAVFEVCQTISNE